MIDARATAWHHLFPADTSFTMHSGPTSLRDAVTHLGAGAHGEVLVSWGDRPQDLPGLDNFQGLVALNSRGLSPRRLREAGFTSVRRFAVLPNLKDPRWFIPLGSPRVADGALRINTPFRFLPYLKHAGARIAARGGVTPMFRNQFIVAQRSASPLEHALQTALGTSNFELAMSTGTPGPARKPTISVLDPQGNWLAFVKLSCSPMSRVLVEHEAHCLRYLNRVPSLASHVPELLFASDIEGTFAAAQRALPGEMPGCEMTVEHAVLLEVMRGRREKPANQTEFLNTLSERIADIDHPDSGYGRALALIRLALQGVAIPRTIVHGDFTPWNLRKQEDGLSVFDWEYAQLDGLPLIDEMQYRLQSGLLLRGWNEDQAWHHLLSFQSIQSGVNYERHVLRALQCASLLEALVRSDAEGHSRDTPGHILRSNLLLRMTERLKEDME